MTLHSGNVKFIRYSWGFPVGRQTTVRLSRMAIFRVCAGYFFGNLRDKASINIWRYAVPCRLFTEGKNAWPWMTLNGYLALNSVFAPVRLASETANVKDNCMKTNKDRPILSAVQIFSIVSLAMWGLGGCLRGFSRKEASNDSGVAR